MPPVSRLVAEVNDVHGIKKDLVLMDNNITASRRYKDIIAEIRDLGFEPGARIERDDKKLLKRRVDFNQGVDARILAKSPMYLREIAKICISPLRIAFDHIGVRKVYEKSIHMAAANGIRSLSNYMLYNFMDTPEDLYGRMNLNISLNEKLNIRIWSFPMRYQPFYLKDRSHVGKNWNRYYLRSFQIMLQATRGIVSGNPDFFRRAYGSSNLEFKKLLSLPHRFIFYRDHYEYKGGRGELDEYMTLRQRFSASQEQELIHLLAGPANATVFVRDQYRRLAGDRDIDPLIRKVLWFHIPDTKVKPVDTDQGVLTLFSNVNPDPVLADDEDIIEDAGLFDHEYDLSREKDRRA